MHGLPVSCPFNFPNDNLKQQLSHIGVFICYQNIDAKNKLNLPIYGIHLLNPHKTVVKPEAVELFSRAEKLRDGDAIQATSHLNQ